MTKAIANVNGSAPVSEVPSTEDFREDDDLDILGDVSSEGAKHYVYRFQGPTSAAKKELVGRLDDVPRPDIHDVGVAYGPGLYTIISRIRNGVDPVRVVHSKVFRVANDYEKYVTRAPASESLFEGARPAAAAPPLEVKDQMAMLREMMGLVRESLPAGGGGEVPGLKAMKEFVDTMTLMMTAQRSMMMSMLPMQIAQAFLGGGGTPGAAGGGGEMAGIMSLLSKFLNPSASNPPGDVPGAGA